MDLEPARYETFDDLRVYCYRVASAVGLCCIEIFGYTDPRTRDYAVNLGIALQLTNILRDLGAGCPRRPVYLPREDLRRFGVTPEDLAAGRYSERFVEMARFQASRARDYYGRAWAALPARDRGRLFAAEIMGRTYLALLDAIEAREFRVLDERVALPTRRRLAIALRGWLHARLARTPRGAAAG